MLNELLQYKENKQAWLEALSRKTAYTPLVLRINVPGQEKKTNEAQVLITYGQALLEKLALYHGWTIEQVTPPFETLEFLAVYLLETSPEALKKAVMHLEDENPCGRVFDFDVYDQLGGQLSRAQFGSKARTCYLCDQPAFVCGRAKTHTQRELNDYLISKATCAFDDMKEDG